MTNKTANESDELELARARDVRQPIAHGRTPSDWNRRARTFDLKPHIGLYEHRDQEPLTRWDFAKRMAGHAAVASVVLFVSLVFGTWGYHRFADLTWGDGFVNSAMLLGGHGQVTVITTRSGKLFSAVFALYSGMILLTLIAVILAPVIHRVLHRFHWNPDRVRERRRSLG
jgi:hypothetical protein